MFHIWGDGTKWVNVRWNGVLHSLDVECLLKSWVTGLVPMVMPLGGGGTFRRWAIGVCLWRELQDPSLSLPRWGHFLQLSPVDIRLQVLQPLNSDLPQWGFSSLWPQTRTASLVSLSFWGFQLLGLSSQPLTLLAPADGHSGTFQPPW